MTYILLLLRIRDSVYYKSEVWAGFFSVIISYLEKGQYFQSQVIVVYLCTWIRLDKPQNSWSSTGGYLIQPPCLNRLFRIVSQWIFNISSAFLGNLCPCSFTLTVKKCVLMFKGNILCFSVCPIASGDVTGHLWELLSLQPLRVFLQIDEIDTPWTFSFLEWASLSQERCLSPLIIFVALCWILSILSIFLLYFGAQNWPQDSTSTEWRGRITFLDLQSTILLIQPKAPSILFVLKSHFWLMFILVSTRAHRLFSAKMLMWRPKSQNTHAWVLPPSYNGLFTPPSTLKWEWSHHYCLAISTGEIATPLQKVVKKEPLVFSLCQNLNQLPLNLWGKIFFLSFTWNRIEPILVYFILICDMN